MKTKLLAASLVLLAGSALWAGPRVFVGVGIGGYGPPPPPPAAYYSRRTYARPGYSWVSGYWYPSGPRYAWRAGYWARPPYARANWVGPRYYGRHYYPGYWRR
ncbi:MAG: hypothetical protein ABI693_08905 [Bryobacteraceae bacterium]